ARPTTSVHVQWREAAANASKLNSLTAAAACRHSRALVRLCGLVVALVIFVGAIVLVRDNGREAGQPFGFGAFGVQREQAGEDFVADWGGPEVAALVLVVVLCVRG